MNKILKLILAVIFVNIFILTAKSQENYTITAKNIEYKDNKKVIIANGSAEATYKNLNIKSENLIYDKNKNIIRSEKKFIFFDEKTKITITGGNFELFINEGKLKALNNIRIVENENFFNLESLDYSYKQKKGFGSKLFAQTKDGTTYRSKSVKFDLNKQIFVYNKNNLTNCKNIKNSKDEYCPIWSINSTKTTHDIKNKKIKHNNATLALKNLPVFYLPYLEHPDPTIRRKSGLLPPSFASISNLGRTIKTPLFWAIGDDKDLTFSPIFYFDENHLYTAQYRQQFKKSYLILETGFTEGYKRISEIDGRTSGSRNHMFIKFQNFSDVLFGNTIFDFQVQRSSQENYLKINRISGELFKSDIEDLENKITLTSIGDNKKLSFGASVLEDLNESGNDKYEYLVPNIKYNFFSNTSNINYDFNSSFIHKKFSNSNDLNNDDQEQSKQTNILNLSSKEINFVNSGFQSFLKANITNINLNNKDVFGEKKDFESQNYFTVAFDSKYPLINYKNKNSYSNIIPRLFAKYTIGKTNNNFKTETFFDTSDLYSINRLNDQENFDKDLSIGYGIMWDKYNYYSSTNVVKQNFHIGQVIREKENQFLPSTSSLNNTMSDVVGTYTFNFNGRKNKNINKDLNVLSLFNQNFFSITYDFAIDNNLNEFNRNSLQFRAGNQFINFTNTYYEIRNHIGNTKFNETTTNILLSNNYYVSSTYRKNLDTNQSESASFSLNYENDCIRYSLSTDKSFYIDKDLKPDRKITFNIIIKPYGNEFAPDLSKFVD